MFTGIVSDLGTVLALERHDQGALLRVKAESFGQGDEILNGESISNSGVCLTVVRFDPESYMAEFDLCSETLRCTTLGEWSEGTRVNLERALRINDRLDGHLVQGHVDCVAEVLEVELQTSTYRVRISLPESIAKFVAAKGSICVDGVSLTVGEVEPGYFQVYIIPHTWEVTAFKNYSPGTKVNLEVDCIARYVARMIDQRKLQS